MLTHERAEWGAEDGTDPGSDMVDIAGDGRKGPPPEPDCGTEIRELLAVLQKEVQDLRQMIESLQEQGTADSRDALLTRQEAADRLGISTRLLDDLADEGEITPVRIRGRVLYEPGVIDDYIRSQAGEGGDHG